MRQRLAQAFQNVLAAGVSKSFASLFSLIDVPAVEQLHIFYRARLLDLDFAAGAETLEVRLFSESEIPWDRIAFRTVTTTLRLFFEDRSQGLYRTHTSEIGGSLQRAPE